MLYRTMEKTGDDLSILGFGCMRLPEKKGLIDEERATRQLRSAIDQGVNYVDTAVPYHKGASEPFLGRALGDGYRERVRLATKLPPWSVSSRADMDKILDAQLKRLRTDRIDYYLVHGLARPSWEKMVRLGVIPFLEKAKQDGRIAHAGFSFHGDRTAFREIVDGYDWAFCQIQYNYLDQDQQAGREGLRYAAGKGLGVIVMEPLRGGHLARKVPQAVQTLWDGASVKRSPAAWSLRWIWDHPEVTVVLSGMNDEGHIAENLRVAEEAHACTLTGEELERVERVRATYRKMMKTGCTGCRYCMPCPSGVDIPGCFEVYDDMHLFGDTRVARLRYMGRISGLIGGGPPACASQCERCGKCVEACPQSLSIPDLLEEVAGTFEGPGLRVKGLVARAYLAVQKWGLLMGWKGRRQA